MSSSEDGDNTSEDCHKDCSGIGTKRVPPAKRRLMEEELPPYYKKLRSLHDALSTPAPEDDSSPIPPIPLRLITHSKTMRYLKLS
ncbi:hypothetical protein MKX01_019687 [Papaver californicum]|nr:hypothetical protein MKX01_019687 [Papaver californicum]